MNLGTVTVKGTAVKNQHRRNTDSLDLRAAYLYQQVTSNGTLGRLGAAFEAGISFQDLHRCLHQVLSPVAEKEDGTPQIQTHK